jgi:hypothetical protein
MGENRHALAYGAQPLRVHQVDSISAVVSMERE